MTPSYRKKILQIFCVILLAKFFHCACLSSFPGQFFFNFHPLLWHISKIWVFGSSDYSSGWQERLRGLFKECETVWAAKVFLKAVYPNWISSTDMISKGATCKTHIPQNPTNNPPVLFNRHESMREVGGCLLICRKLLRISGDCQQSRKWVRNLGSWMGEGWIWSASMKASTVEQDTTTLLTIPA